jgi:hypothetical protein
MPRIPAEVWIGSRLIVAGYLPVHVIGIVRPCFRNSGARIQAGVCGSPADDRNRPIGSLGTRVQTLEFDH